MSCNDKDDKLVRTITVWTDGVSFFATSEEAPRIFIHANSLNAVYVGLAQSLSQTGDAWGVDAVLGGT